MTKEKIDVCFVGTDQEGNTQLNRKAVYFGNAFAYTVDFDPEENQGFQSHKDLITLLVTVTNYGTSTIKNCVLTVGNDKTYPLNMTVAAGQSVPERVNIPYTMGTGIDTKMTVEYDDVLGLSDEEQISKNSSRAMANAGRRGQNIREQNTALFFPYKPKLKCFVVAQRVDKNGDNYITICVRNYSRRRLPKKFAIIVGLKDTSYGSIVYNTKGNDHIKYGTKTLLCNLEDDNNVCRCHSGLQSPSRRHIHRTQGRHLLRQRQQRRGDALSFVRGGVCAARLQQRRQGLSDARQPQRQQPGGERCKGR